MSFLILEYNSGRVGGDTARSLRYTEFLATIKTCLTRAAFLVLLLIRVSPAFGAAPELTPERERILELILADGTSLAGALLSYQAGTTWYLPLSETSEALGLAVRLVRRANGQLEGAEGYILSESRRFNLDLSRCETRQSGKTHAYSCSQAIPFGQEIYVDSRVLSEWIPVDFSVDSFKSQAVAYPREPLPLQLRKQREREAERQQRSTGARDLGYPRLESRDSLLEGVTIDQQLGLQRQLISGERSDKLSYDTSLGGQLLGMDAYSNLRGANGGIEHSTNTLSRKDPDARLLGVLHAREYQLIDVQFPSLSLVSLGGLRKGVYLSSYPLDYASTFSTQEFQGPLLPGWEVELFQNDILLGRQVPDANGRYEFKAIPLYYGRNQFRLAFYGPFGQRRDEYSTFQVGPGQLPEGTQAYRAAFALKNGEVTTLLQTDRSLSRHFTLSGAYSRVSLPFSSAPDNFGYFGMNAFADSVLFTGSFASRFAGGRAYEAAVRLPVRLVTLGLKLDELNEFKSEVFNSGTGETLVRQVQADANFVIPTSPGIGTSVEAIQHEYLSSTERLLRGRLSSNFGPFYWNNELTYFLASENPVRGMFDVSWVSDENRLRSGLGYDSIGFPLAEAEFQGRFLKVLSVTTMLRREFRENFTQYSANASRLFRGFTAGLNATVNSRSEYTLGALVTLTLAPDRFAGTVHAEADPAATLGAASVRVFQDDRPAPGMVLLVNERDEKIMTDERGFAYLGRLQPYLPYDVSISAQSFQDPLVRPAVPGYRFTPRPGHTDEILFPLVSVGQVDGVVQVQAPNGVAQPGRRVPVELVQGSAAGERVVKSFKTDSEGIYWIEDVAPGNYFLRVSPEYLRENRFASAPARHSIFIPHLGSVESGRDFRLAH